MTSLFMGDSGSDKYLKGPWNREDQVGRFVQHAMQINGETRLAVRDAFKVYEQGTQARERGPVRQRT